MLANCWSFLVSKKRDLQRPPGDNSIATFVAVRGEERGTTNNDIAVRNPLAATTVLHLKDSVASQVKTMDHVRGVGGEFANSRPI